jgi:ribonuclease D
VGETRVLESSFMPQPPPEIEPEIVRGDLTEDQLQAYLSAKHIAVDTETRGLNPMRDRLCVVQVCDRNMRGTLVQIPERHGAVSAPATECPSPRLRSLLENKSTIKVFHFARFDVAALRHNLAIDVDPVYCTRTVSKLIRTYTNRHGLKDNLLELLDVEMDKTARHTDWSSPVLDADQIRYAISDVTLLLPLMDKLDEMLERNGRSALAQECFRAIPTLAKLDLLGYEALFEHH